MISVTLPPRRSTKKEGALTDIPCGGRPKSIGCLLTPAGNGYAIKWKVIVPNDKLLCSISVTDGNVFLLCLDNNNENFRTLFPLDKSADESGYFPCGRGADITEVKVVDIPKDLACEYCILQFSWKLPDSEYHTCSDFVFDDKKSQYCLGKSEQCSDNCVCGAIFAKDYASSKP